MFLLDKLATLRGEKRAHLVPWFILLVGALNVIFVGGKRRTFAVFISALRSTFNDTSRTEFNWIGASYTGVAFISMPIVTNFIIERDRAYRKGMLMAATLVLLSCFSSSVIPTPWVLFLTHTLLHGVGSSLILSCTALVVGEYFDQNHRFHVLATTLVSGGPYGALIFGPIYGNMVETYGWRNSFRIIGITFMVVIGLGAYAYHPKFDNDYQTLNLRLDGSNKESLDPDPTLDSSMKPSDNSYPMNFSNGEPTEEDETNKSPHTEFNTLKKRPLYTVIPHEHLRKNPQIYLWLADRVLHTIVMYSLMMNLVEMMGSANHLTLARASSVNLLFGLGESITFTAGALFGDRIRGKLAMIYLFSTLASMCFLTLTIYIYEIVFMILILAFLVGMSIGVGNTCVYATAEEVMCIHGSVGFPATNMIAGVGLFLTPIFSGLIIDRHGYKSFFQIQAMLSAARFVLLGLTIYLLRKKLRAEADAAALAATAPDIVVEKEAPVGGQQQFPPVVPSSGYGAPPAPAVTDYSYRRAAPPPRA